MARTIAEVWWIMLVGAVVIFGFVMLLLVVALRRGAAPAGQDGERGWMWGFGLGFPLVTLAALTVYGLHVGERLLPRDSADVVTVRAEARQWVWSFGYADLPGFATEGVLHIPAGRPVNVEIASVACDRAGRSGGPCTGWGISVGHDRAARAGWPCL